MRKDQQTPGGLDPQAMLQAGLQKGSGEADPAAPDSKLQQPDTLQQEFAQYEILELIGCGGMGVVYKARDRQLDHIVALKIMTESLSAQPRFIARFEREARALARLSHENIVAIHDFGKAGTRCFMVMEFVEGTNLRAVIRSGVTPAEALAIVPQICAALQYAHDHGVVHRDIKPENILMNKDGRVKVADFGLAKMLSAAAEDLPPFASHTVIGTPAYMAPEQIENPSAVDHRADVYAIGVVFYELLTGELPLGVYKPPSERLGIDVRLDAVVLRALERKPELRYQQASELQSTIETASRYPAKTQKPSQKTATRSWLQLFLWIVGGSLLALALVVIMVVLFSAKARSGVLSAWPRDEREQVSREPIPEVGRLLAKTRQLVISYNLGFDAVFPDYPWQHEDRSRLDLYPEGTWPEILGPIGGSAEGNITGAGFRLLGSKDEDLTRGRVNGRVAYKETVQWPLYVGGNYTTAVFLEGIGRAGSLVSETYALLISGGDVAGKLISESYSTIIIDGDLTGSITSTSYTNVMITGDCSGDLRSESYGVFYVLGDFTGTMHMQTPTRLYIDGYLPEERLDSITADPFWKKQKGKVYLAKSDLPAGVHERELMVITVGEQVEAPDP